MLKICEVGRYLDETWLDKNHPIRGFFRQLFLSRDLSKHYIVRSLKNPSIKSKQNFLGMEFYFIVVCRKSFSFPLGLLHFTSDGNVKYVWVANYKWRCDILLNISILIQFLWYSYVITANINEHMPIILHCFWGTLIFQPLLWLKNVDNMLAIS